MKSASSARVATRVLGLAILPLLAACGGGNGGTGPEDETPVITITGVEAGDSLAAPFTIGIAVSPGTYSATLNGAPFISGGTVTAPGSYTLIVNARNGLATAQQRVDFTAIGGGTGDVLIVRVFDLLGGTSGAPGDAILLTDSSSAGMTHALIDAGARNDSHTYVRSRLAQLDVDTLRFMQLTHAHFDHAAGLDEILTGPVHVRAFLYNGQVRSSMFYDNVLAAAHANADSVVAVAATRVYTLGGGSVATTATVLPPLSTWITTDTNNGDELNEGSLGTLVEHGGFRMFFTGDGEVLANQRWRTTFASLTNDVDALKVGHHGANNAIFDDGFGSGTGATSPSAWLTHTDPDIAVISSNGDSHPRIRALNRLMGQTVNVYCTSVHGEIRLTIDESGFWTVQVERNADSDCEPGSSATT